MTYYEQINKLGEDFFGNLTFEELENIFDIKLIGLSVEQTEQTLATLRDDWFEMDWKDAMEIIQEFDKEINN
jgi:hypothetical protein